MTLKQSGTGAYYMPVTHDPVLSALVQRAHGLVAQAVREKQSRKLADHQDAIDWLTVQYLEAMNQGADRRRHDLQRRGQWREWVSPDNEDGQPQALAGERFRLWMAEKAARGVVYRLLRCQQPESTNCNTCRGCGG